jgi:hypothetical protein
MGDVPAQTARGVGAGEDLHTGQRETLMKSPRSLPACS